MTLVAGLPTSIVVISRFDGWNSGIALVQLACLQLRQQQRSSTGTGLADACGIGHVALHALDRDHRR